MFVDEVIIKVIGGKGGDGCTAFRREKYVPLGGPDGGNGGKGSDIIFKVDEGLRTLLDLRYNKIIKGNKGQNGSGKNKTGRQAEDVVIKVPPGTIIKDIDSDYLLADLNKKGQEYVVAKGGRGGRGNKAFASHLHPAPDISENGEPGEERTLKVELKLLADVGLVGMPSVGKSTILSVVSASKPKIGAYHFTTLQPNLGVVQTNDNRSYTIADLPGLIAGASQGEGLGDEFLKHIERTKVIAHVIDMSAFEGRNPYEDYVIINKELEDFNPQLLKKPMIIIANKMDMESSKDNLKEFKKKVKLPIYEISAIKNQGLDQVLLVLADMLDATPDQPLFKEEAFEDFVLYKFKQEKPFTITKESGEFIVRGDTVEKLLKMTKFNTTDGTFHFMNKLKYLGIDEELKKLGVKEGDTVRILNHLFEYKD